MESEKERETRETESKSPLPEEDKPEYEPPELTEVEDEIQWSHGGCPSISP